MNHKESIKSVTNRNYETQEILDEVKKDMKKARIFSAIAFSFICIATIVMGVTILLAIKDKFSTLVLFCALMASSLICLVAVLYSHELRDRTCQKSLKKILTYPIDNEASKNNFARLQRSLAASKDTESCISEWLYIESAEEKVTVKQEIINRKL